MSISSRIHDTLEGWQAEWKDRLRGWIANVAETGIEKVFDFFEPDLRDEITTSLNRLKEIPGLPGDYKAILDKATTAPGAIQLAAILPYFIALMMGFAMGSAAPASRFGSYFIDKMIHSARIDPAGWITAFRRKYEKFADIEGDLEDQGWSDERKEALKFITLFLPTADEQTTWLAKEVYEPEMITKYGLDSEMPVYEETDFDKVGVTPEQMRNKWRAHWIHASWMQVVEMLHRGLITEEDVWRWFRVVEIPPYWRQLLIETAYTWPTRVDVRRWWDMRTIDEARLKELYMGMGYRGKNLDDYILWTKVYVAFPDLIARWKNGWITEDEVRSELIALGMPSDRVETMIQTKIKGAQPERVAPERALTKTDIYKAIKKGLMTIAEGVELLMDLGYSEDEAVLLIETNVGALEGSPETYMEFKRVTQLYRKAMGLSATIPPPELLEAERALKEAEATLKAQQLTGDNEKRLLPYLKAKDDAGYRYRQLLTLWQEEKRKEGGL